MPVFQKHNITIFATLAFLLTSLASADAHFVWLKSSNTDAGANAVLSFGESPAVEDYNLPESLDNSVLWWRGKSEKTHDLDSERVETDDRIVIEAPLPSGDSRVLEATCTYGLYHSTMLKYYAKHINCQSAAELGKFGPSKKLKLDIVPSYTKAGLKVAVYWQGKPLAGAKLTITDSQDKEQLGTTSPKGTAEFSVPAKGLVSVLTNFDEKKASGEFEGKPYNGISNYATLTFTSHANPSTAATAPTPPIKKELAAGELPRLPEAAASFGAAVNNGWLYIYSGHTGGAHEHSRDNLAKHFCRVRLDGGQEWEELKMEQPLQGFPLVSHGNSVYRVGGMYAKNEADEEDELYSVADFSRYDPKSQQWQALPALPAPRSSHDAVVIGNQLYVSGGWELEGGSEGTWQENALVFDLTNPKSSWQPLPEQPFRRRALATSQWQGKLAVVGGIDEDGEVSRRFDLYDSKAETWSQGPEIPGKRMGGFGISAWNHADNLYISGLDGIVYQLAETGKTWHPVGELATPRFFHRLLPAGEHKLLVIGGASFSSGHLDDVEFIDLTSKQEKPAS